MAIVGPTADTAVSTGMRLGDRYGMTTGKNPVPFGGSTRIEKRGMDWQRKLLDMLLGNQQEHIVNTEALKTYEQSKIAKQGLNMATLRMDNGLTPDLQTDPTSVLSAPSPPATDNVSAPDQVTPDLKSLLLALLMQAHG